MRSWTSRRRKSAVAAEDIEVYRHISNSNSHSIFLFCFFCVFYCHLFYFPLHSSVSLGLHNLSFVTCFFLNILYCPSTSSQLRIVWLFSIWVAFNSLFWSQQLLLLLPFWVLWLYMPLLTVSCSSHSHLASIICFRSLSSGYLVVPLPSSSS